MFRILEGMEGAVFTVFTLFFFFRSAEGFAGEIWKLDFEGLIS
jgi:hypothetical protein